MKENKKNIFLILILSIVVMIPLIIGPSSLGHDTVFHVANIDSIKLDLEEVFLPNRISSTIGNNYGYGTHLFYPILPHTVSAYIALGTSLLNINTLWTLPLIYGLITFVSAVLIYFLSKKLWKKNSLALLSSIIYLFMPYRLGDIVVRSALNEVFTFLFIPLVLLGLLYFLEDNQKKFYLYFITGCVGLIYSHLVITLYFALLLIPFVMIYRKEFFQSKRLKVFLKATILIILLALPGIIPMMEHKLVGEYMIYEKDYMTNLPLVEDFTNHLSDYVKILKDYSWDIPMYMNYLVIALILTRLYFFIREKKKDKKEIFLWIFTGISFLMTLNIFPWKYVPSLLYFIQFPWRMMTMLTVSISLIAPLALKNIKKKNIQKYLIIAVVLLIPCTEIPLIIKLSNDTYEIGEIDPNSGMGHSKEYLPKKAYLNELYFEYRGDNIMLISGNASISIIENTRRKIEFEMDSKNEEVILEFPRLYYLGYQLKTKDGKVKSLEESENGFLQATIEKNGTYTLVYKKTTLEKISYILCILGLGAFVYTIKNESSKKIKEKENKKEENLSK